MAIAQLTNPVDVAVDRTRSRLYWIDHVANKLKSSGLDGENPADVTDAYGSATQHSLQVEEISGKVFWVDHLGTSDAEIISYDPVSGKRATYVQTGTDFNGAGLALLLTKLGEEHAGLSEAYAEKKQAQSDSDAKIAQAHVDAEARKKTAYQKKIDSQNQADTSIKNAQDGARNTRYTADQHLLDAKNQATQTVTQAQQAKTAKIKQANAQATATKDNAYQQAASIRNTANDKLRKARGDLDHSRLHYFSLSRIFSIFKY